MPAVGNARIPHLGVVLVGLRHEDLVAAQERVLDLFLYLQGALLNDFLAVYTLDELLSLQGFTRVREATCCAPELGIPVLSLLFKQSLFLHDLLRPVDLLLDVESLAQAHLSID